MLVGARSSRRSSHHLRGSRRAVSFRFFSAALGLTLALGVFPAHGADLLEVYRLAQSRDAIFGTARATWTAAQEKIPQGRALLLPAVTASANTNYNDRDIAFRNGTSAPGRFNTNSYTVALTQPIYRPQNNAQYAQARLAALQADAQLAAATQDLILRLAQAYFDILLAQDTLELALAQKTVINQQLGQARLNFELGGAVSTDVHEAQARYDLVVSQEVTARNDLLVRRRALNAIITTEPGAVAGLGPDFRLERPRPDDMEQWVTDAIANSPQLAAQRRAVDIAMQEIDRSRYGHWPTLDAVASYGRNSSGSGILGGVGYDITQAIVGLQLAVPLYQGGSVNAKTREAAANADKARQELEASTRQVAFAVEQAFAGVSSGIAQVQALRAALASTEKQVHATQIGHREGARSAIDLLNAQQQLFQARRELAQAQYGYLMNRLRLSAAAGSADETDLIKVNMMLTSGGGFVPADARVAPPVTLHVPYRHTPDMTVARERAERFDGLRMSVELAAPPPGERMQ